MSKERMKHEHFGSKITKKQKKDLSLSARNQLNVLSCLYYYFEILNAGYYDITSSYDKDYGDLGSDPDPFYEMMLKAKHDLSLKADFSNTFDKVSSAFKITKKKPLAFRKYMSSIYEYLNKQAFRSENIDFFATRRSIVLLCSVYGVSLTNSEIKTLESFKVIDFYDIRATMISMSKQCDLLDRLLLRMGSRVDTSLGNVVYNGKSVDSKSMARMSKFLKDAYVDYMSFFDNTSEWLYLSDDLRDLPILISDLSVDDSEGGTTFSGVLAYYYQYDTKKKDLFYRMTLYETNIITISKFLLKASRGSIYKTVTHEFAHAWENHIKRYDSKRYTRFKNAWGRYFIELKTLGGFNPNRKLISQQEDDFLDGLSDYIKVTELKKSWKLELRKKNIKPMYFPNKASLVNSVAMMLTPSRYGLVNQAELLAETFSMLSSGQASYIGVDINSTDLPSFYVPAKRLLKLVKRYGFDK